MLFSGIMGREAFLNLESMGSRALSVDIFYLTDFREYIADLYLKAMTGYAGMGDDNGFPLTDSNASKLSRQNVQQFEQEIKVTQGDILYYIEIENDVPGSYSRKTNINYPLFSEYDGHLLLPETISCLVYWDGPGSTLHFFGREYDTEFPITAWNGYSDRQYRPNMQKAPRMRLLLAVDSSGSFTSYKLLQFRALVESYRLVLLVFFSAAALFLIAGFFCLVSCRTARLMWQDFADLSLRIWMEWKVLGLAAILYLCYFCNLWAVEYPRDFRLQAYRYLWLYWPVGILLYLFNKDLRLNGVKFWKHSLTGSVIRFLRDYVTGMKWYRKALLLCAMVLLGALILLVSGILLYMASAESVPAGVCLVYCVMGALLLFTFMYLRHFMKDTDIISTRLHTLRDGTAQTPIRLSGRSLLHQAAEDLNALEDGIEAAVEQQNRSNKMRVELITNVSHDLKTPLTSIINYADLLCEEALPAPASEYASALQAKAYRLKDMVQDVFDLSKATSGNLPVEKTVLDFAKLLKQTLADMDERILASTLTVKLSISTEPVMIEADGEKLYRIFQNLIVNALQYSLENSRIHIQLTTENGYAIAKVKNTSRQELDFDSEEITERFVRADTSRTTEGSGLGLSIVQSFTEACGGSFRITTDADMFTACVSFPLAETLPQPDAD